MGYYTKYQIEVIQGNVDLEDVRDYLIDAGWPFEFSDYEDTEGNLIYYLTAQYKRFNSTKVMAELSKAYPDTVFRVRGQGETWTDNWTVYYCNGMFQNANRKVVITEDEYDYNKLVSAD